MHQCSGQVRVVRNGAHCEVAPVEAIEIDFPKLGKDTVYSVGHPEAITLPRRYPNLQECVNVMVINQWLARILRQLGGEIDKGNMTEEDAARLLESGSPPPEAQAEAASRSRTGRLPPLFALARGRSNGQATRVGSFVNGAPPGGMAGATGVPLAIGAELLSRGVISKTGVFTPEEAFDPIEFFNVLAPHCKPSMSGTEDLVSVVKSTCFLDRRK